MKKLNARRRHQRSVPPVARTVHSERLEARRLLASISFDAVSGILNVSGTSGNDIIQ